MSSPSQAPSTCGNILIIEDDPVVRKIEELHLGKQGHQTLGVSTGKEGLEQIEKEIPDLVLIDHQLPDMMGAEICESLQSSEATRDVPVIMVTAEASPQIAAEYFKKGAADYIRKPFSPVELCARVEGTLANRRNTQALSDWKRNVSRDLEVAGALQKTLASAEPLLDFRVRVRAEYLPSLHVGGDFLEVTPLSEKETLICVGDVAGHGVAASMVASLLKSLLVNHVRLDPKAELFEIANLLHQGLRKRVSDPSVYATLFLARVLHEEGRIECLSCGHPNPCLHPFDQKITTLLQEGGAPPVGFPTVGDQLATEDSVVVISPSSGSTLLAYTDGLSEALHSETGEELEPEGVARLLENCSDCLPRDLLSALLSKADKEGYRLDDDCSLVSISLLSTDTVVHENSLPCSPEAIEPLAKEAHAALLSAGMNEADADRAQLLIMEHFGNVLQHGHAPEGSRLSIQIRKIGPSWEFLCKDAGREWRGKTRAGGPSDPLKEDGRGLGIIDALCDASERHRRGGRNQTLYLLNHSPDSVPA